LEIFKHDERQHVAAGTVIFREKESGDVMYLIIRGRVAISKQVMDRVDKRLDILEPGDYFGEMSLLLQADRSATAVALEPAELVEISQDKLKSLLRDHAEFGVNLLAQLARRLEKANEEAILTALELELSKRRPRPCLVNNFVTDKLVVATGSFEAPKLPDVLRLRNDLRWAPETNVLVSLIKPGQHRDALLYVLQTDDVREIMKLPTCFKDLVEWDISFAISAESTLLDDFQ
jgi:hypothetical protein